MATSARHHRRYRTGRSVQGAKRHKFYDARLWRGTDNRQGLRDVKLQQNPLCEDCEANGKTVAAHDVDHVIPIADRPDLRADINNLRSLCKSCHSKKTVRQTR